VTIKLELADESRTNERRSSFSSFHSLFLFFLSRKIIFYKFVRNNILKMILIS